MDNLQHQINCTLSNIHYVSHTYHHSHPHMIHKHPDELELLYITNGTGQYLVNGRRYVLKAGNLIICRPGVLHGESMQFKNSMESYCIALKDVHIKGFPDNFLKESTLNPVLNFSDSIIKETYENLVFTLNTIYHETLGSTYTCNIIASSILSYIMDLLSIRHRSDDIINESPDDFVYKVIRYLDEHFKEKIFLEKIASNFHISQSYLSHIFKSETGMSVLKYVMQLKIGEAQSLLMKSDYPIGDISYQLSFNDNSHFNIMFKKYTGLSPSQYRSNFHEFDKKHVYFDDSLKQFL